MFRPELRFFARVLFVLVCIAGVGRAFAVDEGSGSGSHGGNEDVRDFVISSANAIKRSVHAIGKDITKEDFVSLLNSLRETKVFFTDKRLCRNDDCSSGVDFVARNIPSKNMIEVHRGKWQELTLKNKLRISLHEHMGIIGLERDNYFLSNKILNERVLAGIEDDILDIPDFISDSLDIPNGKLNFDNTITISSPTLIRGRKKLLFTKSSNKKGVCKSLGFKNYLKGSAGSRLEYSSDLVQVDESGRPRTYVSHSQVFIAEITCYNGNYSSFGMAEDYIQNRDNTVTLTGPKLLRGKNKYLFSRTTQALGICKAFGFSKYLEDSAVMVASYSMDKSAYLSRTGLFLGLESSGSRIISELTCYSGDYSSIAIPSL